MNNKVSNYRRYIGLTQNQMANNLKISVTAYRNKERGITPFKDSEKVFIKNKLIENGIKDITIDDIFLINK
ncbi:TPA: hypothetical protein RFS38_001856 [Staphylococcus aureus]|uniref:hypothetical protein n=1 Tax=Staphylococcus TaxID=1279 RepID=UPI00044BC551|nr:MULTISPECIES: hypothetical protein [Staphylococcus]AXV42917.1 hypothetical protein Ssp1_19030 [Staphylococcus sp. M0911]EXO51146.1 hypothetical protein W311_00553 [Staphylococcus aureus DAR5865]MBO2764602.1 hypothetical protein [Staphylococcus aureus]MBO8494418.1 hypothetical protein [Staphylococcus aureus]MBU4963841.1 hypothetical protein [Staphylococcus aureus]